MYKYKKFFIPLFLSLSLIFVFSIYQYSYIDNDFTSYANASANKDDATFYIASDIHYLSPDLTDNGEAFTKFSTGGDGKQLNYISNIFDAFIYDIKINSPDFLIISGDLTVNGEKESHLKLSSKLKDIEKLGTTVYVVPGNHDINNPWARKFIGDKQVKIDTVSSKDFASIYNNFGYKEALLKDTASLSYLVAPTKNMWLLMLDDNNYSSNMKYNMPDMSGSVSKETLQWIKSCSSLAEENNAKIVLVTHHNLMNHSEFIWDGYTLDNNTEVLSVLEECNINLAFTGHMHFQSIKNYKNNNYYINDISSASLAVYPQKYGILKVNSDNTINYNTNMLNIDAWSVNNISNTTLYNFNSLSKENYKKFILNQNFRNLSNMDCYSVDEINSMCETLINIRLKYDSYLPEVTWEEIRSSNGFELLKSCNSVFMKHYVKLAIEGNEELNNKIDLRL